MPDDEELSKIILVKQVLSTQFDPAHLEQLTGLKLAEPEPVPQPEGNAANEPAPPEAGDDRQPERNTGRGAR
jgi:hypothetical protein